MLQPSVLRAAINAGSAARVNKHRARVNASPAGTPSAQAVLTRVSRACLVSGPCREVDLTDCVGITDAGGCARGAGADRVGAWRAGCTHWAGPGSRVSEGCGWGHFTLRGGRVFVDRVAKA